MYPGMMWWWKRAQRHGCGGEGAFAGEAGWQAGPWQHGGGDDFGGGGAFGVRRPLRFLAFKLKLTEPQVSELAAILDELKTERAQAAVDDRRTLTSFADAMAGEAFDAKVATEGAALREKSADRLAEAVVKALGRIHKLLTPDQRERFAYLIRTGALTI